VTLPDGADLSTVTAGADQLPLRQPCLYGTTAWTTAWTKAEGKRQLVETANSFLHGANGAITDIGRGYKRLRDSGRIKLFLTFTIVGYNRSRIHVWLHDHRMLPATHPDPFPPSRRPGRHAKDERSASLTSAPPRATGRPQRRPPERLRLSRRPDGAASARPGGGAEASCGPCAKRPTRRAGARRRFFASSRL
jgi:hypothetical protein